MGIYITEPSTNEEDCLFIQELIKNGQAYESNGKIYHKCGVEDFEEETILWEKCSWDINERFLGDPGPFKGPWGVGRFTRDGYNYIFIKLQSLGRTTSTL